MKTNPSTEFTSSRAAGLTRLDLVAVLGAVVVLLVCFLPWVGQTAMTSNSIRCRSNLARLSLACVLYANDNGQYLPWAPSDYTSGRTLNTVQVFAAGGPGTNLTVGAELPDSQYVMNPDNWSIHSECGSLYAYATGGRKSPVGYFTGYKNIAAVYRCPDTGIKGQTLRVNYSLNRWTHPAFGKVGPMGAVLDAVPNPGEKVLLAQLAPWVMADAGFTPGEGAGTNIAFQMHDTGIPFAFMDGHVEGVSAAKAWRMTTNETDRYFHPTRR
jgi:prepilin-type processing-associated H-X9-DG protein